VQRLLPFGPAFDNTSKNDHKTVGTVTVYEAAANNVFLELEEESRYESCSHRRDFHALIKS
jgi:hypothetical protein